MPPLEGVMMKALIAALFLLATPALADGPCAKDRENYCPRA